MTTEKVESDLKFWVDAYWEIEEDRLRGSGWELSLIVSHPMTHATLRFGPMAVASRDGVPYEVAVGGFAQAVKGQNPLDCFQCPAVIPQSGVQIGEGFEDGDLGLATAPATRSS